MVAKLFIGTRQGSRQPITKVFAKAGLDNVTSAMCMYQQRFGLDVKFSAFTFNLNRIFAIGHMYRADVFRILCLRKYSTLAAILEYDKP